jgi:hypothetical protein
MGELNWWIVEEADYFSPPLQYDQRVGKSAVRDKSNPVFEENEVKEEIDDVLERVREWRETRVRWTAMAAAMGRCYALDLVRGR